MAAIRRLTSKISVNIFNNCKYQRNFSTFERFKSLKTFEKVCIGFAGGSILLFAASQLKYSNTVHAFKPKKVM